ncbi:hypothetical protein [Pantoea sp. 18069]|uniref:hypothetical protein n=1 Tax=Pantoea sp. 18069 TaxID=2681415 RepID=UPI001358DC7A|nr:hypothetical protein [Pantoea sp. 18069]
MPVPRIADSSFLRRTQRQLRWGEESHRQTAAACNAANGSPEIRDCQEVLQDAFWHDHYHLQPYYVSGRGYDQYRPAYELGWKAAVQYPGDLTAVMPVLEAQWPGCRGTSLLAWRQVASAVQAAWERMRHADPALGPSQVKMLCVLQGLQRLNLQTVKSLQLAITQAPPGLVQQMLQRHLQAFEAASAELAHEFALPAHDKGDRLVSTSLLRSWELIKSVMAPQSNATVLDASENAERMLLMAYRAALREGLPEAARAMLLRQAMAVQRGIEALRWLRS